MTQRTELGPSRALPTARQARVERGIRHSPTQCAQLTLTPDVVWDRDFGSRCASARNDRRLRAFFAPFVSSLVNELRAEH
ncbi:MAG: hypothetical protein GQ551_06655 [Myxococcales bacterium]|nr:hypothetical protein [Myxococcales bacterium]